MTTDNEFNVHRLSIFYNIYHIILAGFFSACTQPAWPTNGVAIASGLNFNASVQYRCFSGYLVSGLSLGRCLADGSWSIPTPTCLIGNNNSLLNFAIHVYVVKRRKCILGVNSVCDVIITLWKSEIIVMKS